MMPGMVEAVSGTKVHLLRVSLSLLKTSNPNRLGLNMVTSLAFVTLEA